MPTILDKIVEVKRDEIAVRKARTPLSDLQAQLDEQSAPRGFASHLDAVVATGRPGVIAEIKRGSPSLGCIRPDLDAAVQAGAYEDGGAAALSVLTDETFFFGSDRDFADTRAAVSLPMLRKDFIIDEYQVYESRALGADCILLILSILEDAVARALCDCVHGLGMDVLAETHSREEIDRAVAHLDFDLLGINNRNLNTFDTEIGHTSEMAEAVADRSTLVAESGLHDPADIAALWEQGIGRFLVGEAFVRCDDPAAVVRSFVQCRTICRETT